MKNPKLYEINTRVWIRKFDRPEQRAKLKDIPMEVWDSLSEKGINVVWMMGIWKTNPETIKKYCFKDYLVRSYDKALRDWQDTDVIGSPYALDNYVVNPELGTTADLLELRYELNKRGIKLFLDFVPNHFSANSGLIHTNPEIFLQVDEEIFHRDEHTFFKPEGSDKIFAHGRDPFFPAWEDTIQVNYYSENAISFMTGTLIKIAEFCDGVRCDMAMLPLENVFYNTWRGVLNKMGFKKPLCNFWQNAISTVKGRYPGFTFMAEAYWDLEWDLQQLGFDYTYDKRLTDRLVAGNVPEIKHHLMADNNYQRKSVRFIENHDEERCFACLGKWPSMAAGVIISTIQGMRFYYDGQFDGRKVKLPVQLGREPEEQAVKCISDFYRKLLKITKEDIFQMGEWKLLNTLPAWEGNDTYQNLLAWQWTYREENRLVVVNYSDTNSQCRIRLDVAGFEDNFTITDQLNDVIYLRSTEEVYHTGLYIDLKAYNSHIFSY